LSALVLTLALLCTLAAVGAGVLLWQRLKPAYVDASVLSATEAGVQALYAYDYEDSEGSVQRKLDVLTGDLRDQYEKDLSQGGIIDTYEQVSATTSYEVLDVGLQQINQAQDSATVVVFGQYVVTSVNSGQQEAPEGSECQVTPEGAQSCTQTVQVSVVQVDGDWKISELTLLTTR
jgi:co-chaperonin GroES (HSP10)